MKYSGGGFRLKSQRSNDPFAASRDGTSLLGNRSLAMYLIGQCKVPALTSDLQGIPLGILLAVLVRAFLSCAPNTRCVGPNGVGDHARCTPFGKPVTPSKYTDIHLCACKETLRCNLNSCFYLFFGRTEILSDLLAAAKSQNTLWLVNLVCCDSLERAFGRPY